MREKYQWLQDYFLGLSEDRGFEKCLGLELRDVEEGQAILAFQVAEKHLNHQGMIHGGALASICDVAMGTAVATFEPRTVTMDLSVSYIRNLPAGSRIVARGWVIHRGASTLRCRAEITDGAGNLLVSASGTFFNLSARPGEVPVREE